MTTQWHFGVPITSPHEKIDASSLGWGEPLFHQAYCSCGWWAIPVQEVYEGLKPTVEPYKTFCDKWGEEIYYAFKNTLVGDFDIVHKQILEHLSYDPVRDLAHVDQELENAQALFEKANLADNEKLSNNLITAVKAKAEARIRAEVWNTVTVKREIEVTDEAKDDYRVMREILEANKA